MLLKSAFIPTAFWQKIMYRRLLDLLFIIYSILLKKVPITMQLPMQTRYTNKPASSVWVNEPVLRHFSQRLLDCSEAAFFNF